MDIHAGRMVPEGLPMGQVNPCIVSQRIQTSTLEPDEKRKALSNFGHAQPDEIEILFDVLDLRSNWLLARGVPIDPRESNSSVPDRRTGAVLRGAHLRIRDDGAHYDRWRNLKSADSRHSSHQSEGQQYHVDGALVHTALFGKLSPWTWLQLERHPWDFRHSFGHAWDAIRYKFTGDNYGPYGTSPYTDSRYIEIMPKDPC
jgi:hypothetical protein